MPVTVDVHGVGADDTGEVGGRVRHLGETQLPSDRALVAIERGGVGATGEVQVGPPVVVAVERGDAPSDEEREVTVVDVMHTGGGGFLDEVRWSRRRRGCIRPEHVEGQHHDGERRQRPCRHAEDEPHHGCATGVASRHPTALRTLAPAGSAITSDSTSSAAPMSGASERRPLQAIVASAPGGSRVVEPGALDHRGLEVLEQALVQTAEDHEVGIEDVDEVADAEPEPSSDLGDRSKGGAVAGRRTLAHLVDAPRSLAQPGVAQERDLSRLGLPAPGRPAPALQPIGIDQRVPRLTGVPGGSAQGPPVHDDPGADPELAGDVDQIADAGAQPATMLRQRSEVGIVGREDGNVEVDLGGEHRRERDVAPSQVGSQVDEPVGPPGDPDDGDADARQGVLRRERVQERTRQLRDVLHRLLRREPATGSRHPDPVVHVTSQAQRRDRDRVDGEVDREHRRALGPAQHQRRRTARSRPGRPATFLDQSEGRELTEQVGDGRPIEPGRRRELGTRQGPREVQSFEHRAEVVSSNLLGGHSPASSGAALSDGGVAPTRLARRVCWGLRRMDQCALLRRPPSSGGMTRGSPIAMEPSPGSEGRVSEHVG